MKLEEKSVQIKTDQVPGKGMSAPLDRFKAAAQTDGHTGAARHGVAKVDVERSDDRCSALLPMQAASRVYGEHSAGMAVTGSQDEVGRVAGCEEETEDSLEAKASRGWG